MPETDTTTETSPEATLIAAQNDAFRKSITDGATAETPSGQVVMTQAIQSMGDAFVLDALRTVAAFDTFTEDNDPWGDHSFGAPEVNGVKVFWKIDLYDLDYEFGSEAPSDPDRTRRVLTIMLPQDY
ncbi:DUF3768 domain-containing protein [Jannaschia aquimarina]|uniref:DUF3768 domain-containing protein n=1 Tax=Jannaschia aquimarina TaxID=935700 RepID=UPI000B6EB045|nr:DUF3768 domain-containing protein [Jannaschia aquimarina]SNT41369.1 Protein of unknown function [Jannaschia aquimarina]